MKTLIAVVFMVASIASAQVFNSGGSTSSSGGAPSGSASGDLGGSYPSPTVVHTQPGSVDLSTVTTALGGKLSNSAGVAPGLIDLSTVTTAFTTKASSGTNNDITSLQQNVALPGGATLPNNTGISVKTSGGSTQAGLLMDSSNKIEISQTGTITQVNSDLYVPSGSLFTDRIAGFSSGYVKLNANITQLLGYQSSTNTKTASYGMTVTDGVIFASSTIVAITTVTLPSAGAAATQTAAAVGQVARIYKIDRSTMPVEVIPASGDSIVGMSTVPLQAFGSHVELISDGVHTWFPYGSLTTQTQYFGNTTDAQSAAAGAANVMYFQTYNIAAPCDTKQAEFVVGTASGKMSVALYDSFGNVVMSSGPFTVPAAGVSKIAVPTVNLQPGNYFLGIGADNATATFTRNGIDNQAGIFSINAAVSPPLSKIGNPPVDAGNSSRNFTAQIQCYGSVTGGN